MVQIGQRRHGDQSRAVSQARADPEAFGAGVGQAMQGLGQQLSQFGVTEHEIEQELKRKKEAKQKTQAARDYAQLSGELDREMAELQRDAEPGADGFTDAAYNHLSERINERLESLPEDIRPEYEARMEQLRQTHVNRAFSFELEEADREVTNNLNSLLEESRSAVHNDPDAFDDRVEFMEQAIQDSGLPPSVQQEFAEESFNALAAIDYERRMEEVAERQVEIENAPGDDVVAPGMPGFARGLLNAIASVESPGYNVMYSPPGGGQRTFEDFSKHPNRPARTPDGRISTAAGRYQFIYGTWRSLQERYPDQLPDFSPASQDRAAWLYAKQRYKQQTGGDLREVLASGDRSAIKQARQYMAGTDGQVVWEGMQHMSDDQFANFVLGTKGAGGGPVPPKDEPDIWKDDRYASLTHEQRVELETQADRALESRREQAAVEQRQLEADILFDTQQQLNSGTMGVEDVGQILQSGQVRTRENRVKLQQMVQNEVEQIGSATRIADMMSNPRSVFTQADVEDMGQFAKRSGMIQGLQERSPNARHHVADMFGKAGRLPENVTQTLLAMAAHSDPQNQLFALQTLETLKSTNSQALMNHNEDLYKLAAEWRVQSRYSADENAAQEKHRFSRDPAFAGQRQEILAEAEEHLEDIGDTEILRGFQSWLGGTFANIASAIGLTEDGAMDMPTEPQTLMRLRKDFTKLYKEGYLRTQDSDAAKEYASEVLGHRWGPDSVGGTNRLMELAPTSGLAGFPTFDGTHQWMREEILRSQDWDDDQEFTLVPDPNSFAEAEAGELPFYQVVYQNELGEFERLRTEDGNVKRVRPGETNEQGGWEIPRRYRRKQERAVELEQIKQAEDELMRGMMEDRGLPFDLSTGEFEEGITDGADDALVEQMDEIRREKLALEEDLPDFETRRELGDEINQQVEDRTQLESRVQQLENSNSPSASRLLPNLRQQLRDKKDLIDELMARFEEWE